MLACGASRLQALTRPTFAHGSSCGEGRVRCDRGAGIQSCRLISLGPGALPGPVFPCPRVPVSATMGSHSERESAVPVDLHEFVSADTPSLFVATAQSDPALIP